MVLMFKARRDFTEGDTVRTPGEYWPEGHHARHIDMMVRNGWVSEVDVTEAEFDAIVTQFCPDDLPFLRRKLGLDPTPEGTTVVPTLTQFPDPQDDGQDDADPAPGDSTEQAGDDADGQGEGLISDTEPGLLAAAVPPKAGPGSSLTAWSAYAEQLGVEVPADATRDSLIAALEAAGHPVGA